MSDISLVVTIFIGVLMCGVGMFFGVGAALFLGYISSKHQGVNAPTIDPEVLAEVLTEKIALQQLENAAGKKESSHA